MSVMHEHMTNGQLKYKIIEFGKQIVVLNNESRKEQARKEKQPISKTKVEAEYCGTSLSRSLMGLGKSDLNSKVTVLPKLTLYSYNHGNPFGTEQR